MKIRDIMSRNVVTVRPDDDARSVYQKFIDMDVHHQPVVADGKPVGIISTFDYRGVIHHAGKGNTIAADIVFGGLSVSSLMTRNPVTLSPDAGVERAAAVMLEHAIHALPVVEESGQLAGIVTAHDILAGVAAGKL